ncbi:hypothetical protein QAD02_013995 [Eretmocerus hayati]|uniref:Uncharacterized protein n=1 Tax=Eretmocerus hayati TaxID=131215 RepID=A0ACC2P539_9HYME|nr:hypothetical protein QAD02_013995 [Eretmocerus hayati]
MRSLICKSAKECEIVLPRPEEVVLGFTNHGKEQDSPYIVHADFECVLIRLNGKLGPNTDDGDVQMIFDDDEENRLHHSINFEKPRSKLMDQAFQKHEPYIVRLYFHHRFDET